MASSAGLLARRHELFCDVSDCQLDLRAVEREGIGEHGAFARAVLRSSTRRDGGHGIGDEECRGWGVPCRCFESCLQGHQLSVCDQCLIDEKAIASVGVITAALQEVCWQTSTSPGGARKGGGNRNVVLSVPLAMLMWTRPSKARLPSPCICGATTFLWEGRLWR